MRLHCNTFGHWKDVLICSMSCPYTQRCKQFTRWREEDEHETLLWQRIINYMQDHPHNNYELIMTPMTSNKKKENVVKQYVCIQENQSQVLTEEEITENLLQGVKFEEIFEIGREMEVQIRLVPAKSKAKSKKITESEPVEKETKEIKETQEPQTSRSRKKKTTSQSSH